MITIIIPVYNTAQYLNQCLESVVAQSYTDWECIVVDDGSSDNSGEVCDEWGKRDNRFVIIHQENQGVSAARNHGMDRSRGEYICFIDSDDWVDADYLSHLLSGMADGAVDMVVTGSVHESKKNEVHASKEEIKFRLTSDFTKQFIDHVGLFYGPCAILYKSSLIKSRHIVFPIGQSFGEDTIFVFQYLETVQDILILPYADYHYRILGQNSLSHRFGEEKTFLRYDLWKMRQQFYTSHDMWDLVSQENMYRELWGIISDGIFSVKKLTLSYLRKILNIKEIDELKHWDFLYIAPKWIKYGILNRHYLFFYAIRLVL